MRVIMPVIETIAGEVAMIWPKIGRKLFADLAHAMAIPHAQLFVVMRLFHHSPASFSDICREMKVSAPTATGIITRLEKAGYVTRTMDKKDRRAVVLDITPEGRKVALKLRTAAVARWKAILEKLSEDDAERYLDILKKISEVI